MKRKALGLFATFFKIGAFTFGGGYAMIPLIQREIVDKKQWATNEDLLDIIAIAESTPGPIAVNAATFIGSKIDGFFGALFATLGVVLPSFITILAVSFAIAQFEHIKIVQYAFTGIRAAVLALIIRALAAMYKECPKSPLSYIIAAAAFLLQHLQASTRFLSYSAVLRSALLYIWYLIQKRKGGGRQMIFIELFFTFFKIGLFTVGGGYAMLPLIRTEVLSKGWLTAEEIVNFIAVSESTPGPFAVNIATYIGSVRGGAAGAVCATLGVVLPSFLIILAIARCYKKFKSSKIVAGLMSGLKPAVIGLIAAAVLTVGKTVF